MSNRNPGDPIFPSQIPANQGIASIYPTPGYMTIASAGYDSGKHVRSTIMPIYKTEYSSKDIAFKELRSDYKL